MTFLSRQSSCVVIVPSQLANHAWLRIAVPTYWVCTFELFTQLQINFYLNFHIFTVEIGQNRNEIDDKKITNNPGSECYLYLKGYLKKKSPLKIVT